jgi:hypothetical protein
MLADTNKDGQARFDPIRFSTRFFWSQFPKKTGIPDLLRGSSAAALPL